MFSENAINFLLYSYFGIEAEELEQALNSGKDEIIMKCAKRAYRDLNRTLKFSESPAKKKGEEKKRIETSHRDFRNDVCKIVKAGALKLLELPDADDVKFDEEHGEACRNICDVETSAVLEITYGQAQKWLNMTMKYMWLLGLWEDQFEKILSVLHVPVDSYIMEAASALGVGIPTRTGGKGEYASERSKPWSQWTDEEYRTFQTGLREALKSQVPQEPLKWEGPAWIDIAQQRALN